MKTPVEVLQQRLEEMTKEYARILKLSYGGCHRKDEKWIQKFKAEKFETLAKINKGINEFNNAIDIIKCLNFVELHTKSK